jgi:hypothetical protein
MKFNFSYLLKSGIELKNFTDARVNDEEDVVNIVQQMLGESGYSVPIISNGSEYVRASEIAYIRVDKVDDEELYNDAVPITEEELIQITKELNKATKASKAKKSKKAKK